MIFVEEGLKAQSKKGDGPRRFSYFDGSREGMIPMILINFAAKKIFLLRNSLKILKFFINFDILQNLHILQISYHSLTIVIFLKNLQIFSKISRNFAEFDKRDRVLY
jgi:hypothetical protein